MPVPAAVSRCLGLSPVNRSRGVAEMKVSGEVTVGWNMAGIKDQPLKNSPAVSLL